MRVDLITLFPEIFQGVFSESILQRAVSRGLVQVRFVNPRDFTDDPHGKVDDRPYGGGPGMILQAEPVLKALESVYRGEASKEVILLSPQGQRFDQASARAMSSKEHLIFLCGHYGGMDERIRQSVDLSEFSIGDFVVTGGEVAALPMIDAVLRLIPGVLGDQDSPTQDSFWNGLLGAPNYTRPRSFRGLDVPEVLISGHHREIARWRREQCLLETLRRRPDLLETAQLSDSDMERLHRISEERT